MSSYSERFSDDQACPTQSSVSPDILSKVVATDEEINDNVKILSEKLSDALLNISAKEELVKQHAKVAEEAVSGWEKAENEVSVLKKKLEASGQRNSALENRVGHLDGALKECVRQLRQAREEQEQKIQEAVEKKTREWESKKSELESQLVELQAQLQTAKNEAPASVSQELYQKIEALEKENSTLKLDLLSRAEEMEIRILERDLSTQAAEMASKQHLESIKKLAKLEAECRRQKIVAKKASPMNDHKSHTATSSYVESFTDSQSDSGERLQAVENYMHTMHSLDMNEGEPCRSDSWASPRITELDPFKKEKSMGRNLAVSSGEINLMDDFLEMERLAGLPGTDVGSSFLEAGPVSEQMDGSTRPKKSAYEALICRISELEEKLKKTEAEKLQLEMALTGSRKQLETLQNQVKEAEGKLLDIQKKALTGSKKQLETLQNQLKKAEGKLLDSEKIKAEKLQLEMALTGSKKQVGTLQTQLKETEVKLEMQKKALTGSQKQLEKLQDQLMNAERKLLDAEKMKAEKFELEMVLTQTRDQLEKSENQLKCAEENLVELQTQIALVTDAKQATEEEVKAANIKREKVESQLRDVEGEVRSLLSKIVSLEEETEKERALSAKNLAKCQELQDEISKMKNKIKLQDLPNSNGDLKIMQEKELAVAANKFAECQKTIASIGQQLKSLATFEDLLLDCEMPLEVSRLSPTEETETLKSYTRDLKLSGRAPEAKSIDEHLNSSKNRSDLDSTLLANPIIASKRTQNGGVGNLFNGNKDGRSELPL